MTTALYTAILCFRGNFKSHSKNDKDGIALTILRSFEIASSERKSLYPSNKEIKIMKKYKFTLNELLAVIAIIGVLAALLFPTLSIARERAKATSCAGNQGQVSKILIDAMSRTKDQLASASEDSGNYKLWTTALYERKLLNSLEFARCPAFEYTSNDVTEANARKEAYGVVIANSDTTQKGKLNFASKKNRTVGGQEISPNKLLLGGCAADKWGDDAKATAALVFSGDDKTYLTAIHRGEVNMFFLDGSVAGMDGEVLATNNIYYPKADNSEAVKITSSLVLSK